MKNIWTQRLCEERGRGIISEEEDEEWSVFCGEGVKAHFLGS